MGIVIYKLKALKLAIKVCTIMTFGNLDHNIKVGLVGLIDKQKWYDEDSFFKEFLQLKYDVHFDLGRLLHQ